VPGEPEPLVPIVAHDFPVPVGLVTESFVLEPLDEGHNAADLAAWTSSIDHIRATPGFADRSWPERAYTLEENAADLAAHATDFARRAGFAYTVLDPAGGDVIGCVYFDPPQRQGYDIAVRSWVRADRAEMDDLLAAVVRSWIADRWPWTAPDYTGRGT